jgi:hypothetical protein
VEGGRWSEEMAESRRRNDCRKLVRHTGSELENHAKNLKSGWSKVRIADEVVKTGVMKRHIVARDHE